MPSNALPSVLNEEARGNIIDFVGKVVGTTLQQSFDYTTDFPGFIADPSPATGPFGVAKAVAQQSCRRWARGEGIPSLPGFDALYGGICEPYLDSIGENPGDGVLGPPFQGGQCPVQYTVSGTYRVYDNAQCAIRPDPINFSAGVLGPIKRFFYDNGGGPAPTCNQSPGRVFRVEGATNTIGLASSPAGGLVRITGVNIVRTAGGADNCGNPPPEYDPPNIPPGLPPLAPITVNIPGIGDVKVDVTFGPNGEIQISLPDLGINVELPNPLFDGEDGGEDGPIPPGFQGEPAEPIDVGPGDAADETSESNLVGVLVQTIQTPPRANRLFNETESYTKGAYFVYFGGDGGLSQNPEAAISRQDQFYYAPEGCNRFRVIPNAGFTLRVTPYYKV